MKNLVFLVCLSIFALVMPLTGCKTSKTGVKNYLGSYEAVMPASPDKIIEAAREVVEQDLKLHVSESGSNKLDGRLIAMTALEKKVTITAESAGDNMSTVSVRIGSGDEAQSMSILDKIRAKL